jgi:hypothetical protein
LLYSMIFAIAVKSNPNRAEILNRCLNVKKRAFNNSCFLD